MAILTHGPRLGNPSPTGFTAWIAAAGATTATLQVRAVGATTWVHADTQALDTTKQNTAILSATGLAAKTKYDYRVTVDGVVGTTYSTTTMPPAGGGRFVVYHVSDCHDANIADPSTDMRVLYAAILSHYTTNYEPLGIPGVIAQLGDFYPMGALNPLNSQLTAQDVWDTLYLPAMVSLDASGAAYKLPWLYMWDDFDYAGNNSAGPYGVYNDVSVTDKAAEARKISDWGWREHTFPAPPCRAYVYEIAGVPFIITDTRSMRTGQVSSFTPIYDYTKNDGNTLWGAAQLTWLRSLASRYNTKGLVVLTSGTTFKDQVVPYISPYTSGGARDSVGIWFRAERNILLREMAGNGWGWRRNLVLWTGDDHWNTVCLGSGGSEKISPGTALMPANGNYPPADATGMSFLEFKVSASVDADAYNAGNGPIIFGTDQRVFYGRAVKTLATGENDRHNTMVVWDITSRNGGSDVSARITYTVGACSQSAHSVGSIETDDLERVGDFYFENGNFQTYNAATGNQNQRYPPENTQEQIWERAYLDDINGNLISERFAVRDLDGNLRDKRDIGDLDADWARRGHRHRQERGSIDP